MSNPFVPPADRGAVRGRLVVPAIYLGLGVVLGAVAALGPLPLLGGVVAMLFGNSALKRILAVPRTDRAPPWRILLGVAGVVTLLGALDFVLSVLLRILTNSRP